MYNLLLNKWITYLQINHLQINTFPLPHWFRLVQANITIIFLSNILFATTIYWWSVPMIIQHHPAINYSLMTGSNSGYIIIWVLIPALPLHPLSYQ